MSKPHSTPSTDTGKPTKPSKPYPEFPLTAHPAGYWCKKIRGKLHYFGRWDDPDGALAKYLEQKDDLHAGRKPRPDPEALTVKALANAFLGHKQALLDAGELAPRTWMNCKEATDLLVSHFGKQRAIADLGPDDFADLRNKMAKRWGPVRVRDFVQRIRSVFKYGFDMGLMSTPMRFGPGFARPTKKTIRLERARKGPRMFEAPELRRILAAAGVPLKAMILLGVNCGFGNADCGTLPLAALDLAGGWVNYHRPKTGITRRCSLWPETVEALREALAHRPKPKNEADIGLAFLTAKGGSWHKKIEDNPISKEMRKLLDALGIDGNRNFYALRHTFETVGGEAKDQIAVDHIMGHARDDMASVYRERISDERLKAVSDHVRTWLLPPTKKDNPNSQQEGTAAGDEGV
ncbi:MAG: site-specific integrase [Gemmataceae bacterium]|nr:site-specific integrase [Gemmataceae bacterium]